jgi:hypothetical protein
MKARYVPFAVLLCAVSGWAGTEYNNFGGGYNDWWHPFGNPNTATYGETFSAPTSGGTSLTSFSFYMGNPYVPGDIQLSAYIATWTGSNIGTVLYSSPMVDYANIGDAELTFDTGGLALTGGADYVAFLSVSGYYGDSAGESYLSSGGGIPGGSFVYDNNGGDFAALSTDTWSGPNSPDLAIDAEFGSSSSIPEPGTVTLLGTGLVGLVALRRRFKF